MIGEHQVNEVPGVSDDSDRRIVVGVDGSEGSLRALEWAAHQAELTDFTLEIVGAWEWPSGFGWASIPEGYEPERDAHEVLAPILASLRTAYPHLTITSKVIEGYPAPVLVEESRGAKLLVVGRRGHGELLSMLVGSTSEHCVANAACPVVVLR